MARRRACAADPTTWRGPPASDAKVSTKTSRSDLAFHAANAPLSARGLAEDGLWNPCRDDLRLVDGLANLEVHRDARQRERIARKKSLFLDEEVDHFLDGDAHGAIQVEIDSHD